MFDIRRYQLRIWKNVIKYTDGENDTNKEENNAYVNIIDADEINEEPSTYEEAINSPFKEKWIDAIKSEVDSLKENKTWSETKRKNTIQTI